MKKILPIIIVVIVIVGGGAFYGGMKYQQNKNPMSGFSRQNFQNLSEEQRQQLQANAGGAFQGGNRAAGQGFLAGEVISKDAQSLIIKMQDGGSKIIFYSDSTEISKFVQGAVSDLEVGETVMINGTANQDGSITAKSIQLRPANLNP